jgi:hypothetical protein
MVAWYPNPRRQSPRMMAWSSWAPSLPARTIVTLGRAQDPQGRGGRGGLGVEQGAVSREGTGDRPSVLGHGHRDEHAGQDQDRGQDQQGIAAGRGRVAGRGPGGGVGSAQLQGGQPGQADHHDEQDLDEEPADAGDGAGSLVVAAVGLGRPARSSPASIALGGKSSGVAAVARPGLRGLGWRYAQGPPGGGRCRQGGRLHGLWRRTSECRRAADAAAGARRARDCLNRRRSTWVRPPLLCRLTNQPLEWIGFTTDRRSSLPLLDLPGPAGERRGH